MGGVDLSRSDMTLTSLLFSTFIQAVEAESDDLSKREHGTYFDVYINIIEILFCCILLVLNGYQLLKEAT